MHELIKLVADYFIIIPVVGIVYLAFRQKNQQRLELLGIVVAGGIISLLLAKLGSHLYNDPRPFVQGHFTPLLHHAADNGFPSDHTLLAAFLGWVTLKYSRKLGLGLLVVAALIGGARMAGGVHHLSDVVGSFVFAGVGCWLAILLVGWLCRQIANKGGKTTEL